MITAFGCASEPSPQPQPESQSDVRGEIEQQFGPLGQDHIDGFEQEMEAQYGHLQTHYDHYDEARHHDGAEHRDHDAHRVHRQLKRRHQTLARLHEDRIWLEASGDYASEVDDRHLAQVHRTAANWHDERYQQDGTGVEPQDTELEVLRDEFDDLLE